MRDIHISVGTDLFPPGDKIHGNLVKNKNHLGHFP